jgi:hypothetical protein
MDEHAYVERIAMALRSLGFDTQRHEDKNENFIPDLSYAIGGHDGWIEFKFMECDPGSLSTIKHYTRGQMNWLSRRGSNGAGRTYLWLGVDDKAYVWRFHSLEKVHTMFFDTALKYTQIACPVSEAVYQFKELNVRTAGGRWR